MAQLLVLVRAAWRSGGRHTLLLLAVGIVAVILRQRGGAGQAQRLAGRLLRRDRAAATCRPSPQLLVFAPIAGGLLALVVAQTWLQEMLKVRLREWLTHDLLDQWLAPARLPAGLRRPDRRQSGPAHREDTRHLTELSADLGVGLFQASLLLVSFVGVLWVLSARVGFGSARHRFVDPGLHGLVRDRLSLGGSLLTWRVGRPLIGLNAERYAREADLRFALVRVSESAESIALYGGEPDERRLLDGRSTRGGARCAGSPAGWRG